MRETVDKFEDNLNIVERLYGRMGKKQLGNHCCFIRRYKSLLSESELVQNYAHFAASIRGLSGLETTIDQPLRQFAEATESYVDAYREMVRGDRERERDDIWIQNG